MGPGADWIAKVQSTMSGVPSVSLGGSGTLPAAGPITWAKFGRAVLRISAAAPAIGLAIASAASTKDRAQPSIPRLSIGTLASTQPIRTPPAKPVTATPIQRPRIGPLTSGAPRQAAEALPQTSPPTALPAPASHRQ